MRTPIPAVAPSAVIADVAMIMGALQAQCVVIEGPDPTASADDWAVISDLDLIRGVLVHGEQARADSIATGATPWVDVEDDVETVCSVLLAHACSYAMVLDAGYPVGTVTPSDIAMAVGI